MPWRGRAAPSISVPPGKVLADGVLHLLMALPGPGEGLWGLAVLSIPSQVEAHLWGFCLIRSPLPGLEQVLGPPCPHRGSV